MTYRPDMTPAEKAAAMEACAEKEDHGQTALPAMLRDGAAAVEDKEWWREMAWRMRSYTVHDDNCSFNRPPHYAGCTCKLRDALSRMDFKEGRPHG